jgi:hypothetical protein
MGCVRPRVFDDAEHTIDTTPLEIWSVPSENVSEGQMDFRNTGATTVALRLGRGKGETGKDVCKTTGPYTLLLLAGDVFTEDGLVPGSIIAVSDVAGGKLSTKVTYR